MIKTYKKLNLAWGLLPCLFLVVTAEASNFEWNADGPCTSPQTASARNIVEKSSEGLLHRNCDPQFAKDALTLVQGRAPWTCVVYRNSLYPHKVMYELAINHPTESKVVYRVKENTVGFPARLVSVSIFRQQFKSCTSSL